jgi:hypothetical protein
VHKCEEKTFGPNELVDTSGLNCFEKIILSENYHLWLKRQCIFLFLHMVHNWHGKNKQSGVKHHVQGNAHGVGCSQNKHLFYECPILSVLPRIKHLQNSFLILFPHNTLEIHFSYIYC